MALIPLWVPSFAGWPGPASFAVTLDARGKPLIIAQNSEVHKLLSSRFADGRLQRPDLDEQAFVAFELIALWIACRDARGFGL